MQYPGFRGVDNLVNEENISIVAMVSTWERPENWRLWQESEITQRLLREAETLLAEEPRVTTYRMMAPEVWCV